MSNKSEEVEHEQSGAMSPDDKARRDFLKQAGRFAAITPPAMTALLTTTMNSKAIAKSGGGKPGYGHGDKNHKHGGPPGLKKK